MVIVRDRDQYLFILLLLISDKSTAKLDNSVCLLLLTPVDNIFLQVTDGLNIHKFRASFRYSSFALAVAREAIQIVHR